MKRIIAAALSILVGVFGYTITDKSIDKRVDNLESSVSSMQEEINNNTTSKSTLPHSTDTENTSNMTTGTSKYTRSYYKSGDIIKYNGSQNKFVLRKFVDRDNNDCYYHYVSPNDYKSAQQDDVILNTSSITMQVISVEDSYDKYTHYNNDYSILSETKITESTKIKLIITGSLSTYLPLKYIDFNFCSSNYGTIYNYQISKTESKNFSVEENGNLRYEYVFIVPMSIVDDETYEITSIGTGNIYSGNSTTISNMTTISKTTKH